MKAISLFSGVGGMDMGFERAGIETVLQAERDPRCLEVLARHWPQTERVNDVRSVGDSRNAPFAFREQGGAGRDGDSPRDDVVAVGDGGTRSGVDLVYGGFPCQDLSVAGKRAGLDGERSGLWFEFHRVLSELRPRWAVIENVPGLLSSNGGRDFGVILDGLDELGFDVAWTILDAQHFGVPQRRRRVFIVAGASRRSVEQVLSLCESCGGNPETSAAPGQAVAGTLGGGAGERGWSPDTDRMTFVASAISASAGHHAVAIRIGQPNSNGLGVETSGLSGAIDATGQGWAVLANAVTASAGHQGHSSPLIPIQGVRRLTPLECERLMGWPDDWTRWTAGGKEIADSHRYRMCGNGVVASVAEWIGHRIVAVDGGLA